MQEILTAIWLQDFDTLLEVSSLHILILLLATILFLESSFVFLPLPGDGLVLFVGGLVGIGAIDLSSAVVTLSTAAFCGSVIAYFQGRWLHDSRFMRKIETTLPDEALPKAKRLLDKYGFFSLFLSRFFPFVRVLTPMLMGVAQLSAIRTILISFTSSITWVLTLLLVGRWVMQHPIIEAYQEAMTKAFLITSFSLMILAFITLTIRIISRRAT